jgi:hypothetical protein
MAEILPLDAGRIADALQRAGVRYLSGADDGLLALFDPPNAEKPALQATFHAAGPDGDVLAVRLTVARLFGADDWPRMLAAMNSWHQDHRWPKGHLEYLPFQPDWTPLARLVAEHHVSFTAGVHDELLEETIQVALATSLSFLSAICPPPRVSQESVTTEELDKWLSDRTSARLSRHPR